MDGVEHAYHFAKDLVVHGGKGSGVDALEDMREGSTVVIHYSVEAPDLSAHEIDEVGDGGLMVTEGIVTRVNRPRDQVTVKFSNGTTGTFRLSERAASELRTEPTGVSPDTRIVIYYSDEKGRRVAHFFKKLP
jgi:hypothetical protein